MKRFSKRNEDKLMNKLYNYRGQEPKGRLITHNYRELNEIITEFINTFNDKFEKYNNNLYNNLRSLYIVINRTTSDEYEGEYKDYENTVYISIPNNEEYQVNDQVRDTLFHELLHVASTNVLKNYSGFDHEVNITGTRKIGRGINEGYTEYLLLNYFNPSDPTTYYEDEIRIIKELEKLLGKDKMIEYYFTGNLYNLITDLSKENDYSPIIELVKDIDYLALRDQEKVLNKVKKRGSL